MARRKSRSLSEDDRAVWDVVARSVRRIEAMPSADDGAEPPARAQPVSARTMTAPRMIGTHAPHAPRGHHMPSHPSAPHPSPSQPAIAVHWAARDPGPVGRPEPGLDKRTAERLRRGERAPDMRIDLHGMTAERAHAALDRFVASALRAGARCLLVITGKGGRIDRGDDAAFMRPGTGVLRDAAPRWLRTGPHASRIVGIYEAHQSHGGGGAFYVYLKKPR